MSIDKGGGGCTGRYYKSTPIVNVRIYSYIIRKALFCALWLLGDRYIGNVVATQDRHIPTCVRIFQFYLVSHLNSVMTPQIFVAEWKTLS